jgi:Holliday junction resolvasome RuvABC endonuclease subunit
MSVLSYKVCSYGISLMQENKYISDLSILAIDPAKNCGWAHSSGVHGVWNLSIRRDESGGMRLLRLRAKLNEIKEIAGVDLCVFEAARHAAPKMQGALVVQTEIQATIKIWCEDNLIAYRGYSPSEIKKHATGKGNANKQMMIDAAEVKFRKVFQDYQHDEVDALWLLDLAQSQL